MSARTVVLLLGLGMLLSSRVASADEGGAPLSISSAPASMRLRLGEIRPLSVEVTGVEHAAVSVSVEYGELWVSEVFEPQPTLASDKRTLKTGSLTAEQAVALFKQIRYVAPSAMTASDRITVVVGKQSRTIDVRFVTVGRGSQCAHVELRRRDGYRLHRPVPYTFIRRAAFNEVELQAIVDGAKPGSGCPTGLVKVELTVARTPSYTTTPPQEPVPATTPPELTFTSTLTAGTEDVLGPGVSFVDVFRKLFPPPASREGQVAAEELPAIEVLTVYASVKVTTEEGPARGRAVTVASERFTLRRLPSPPLPEAGFVTHPGAFALTVMSCSDLLGSAAPALGADLTQFQQRCLENPSLLTAVDSLTVAPVGVHMRWAAFPRVPWLGLGIDVSALALGTAGNLTVDNSTDDGTGLFSPMSAMTGLDLALTAAKANTINMNVLVGAGVSAVRADGSYRPRPFFGLTVLVPIATVMPAKDAKPPADTGQLPPAGDQGGGPVVPDFKLVGPSRRDGQPDAQQHEETSSVPGVVP